MKFLDHQDCPIEKKNDPEVLVENFEEKNMYLSIFKSKLDSKAWGHKKSKANANHWQLEAKRRLLAVDQSFSWFDALIQLCFWNALANASGEKVKKALRLLAMQKLDRAWNIT